MKLKTLGVFDTPKEISTLQENNKHISDPITGGDVTRLLAITWKRGVKQLQQHNK